jgi:hypothetical protein
MVLIFSVLMVEPAWVRISKSEDKTSTYYAQQWRATQQDGSTSAEIFTSIISRCCFVDVKEPPALVVVVLA